MGIEVTCFFTFWGLNVLKEKRLYEGKAVMERMIDLMTPTGPGHMGVSRMNMGGAGAAMLKHMMKDKNVLSGAEFLNLAKESGVRLIACSMSMDVMGIRKEELTEGIEVGGAAAYLGERPHAPASPCSSDQNKRLDLGLRKGAHGPDRGRPGGTTFSRRVVV